MPTRDIDLPNTTGDRDPRLPSAARSADLRLQREFYAGEAARRRKLATKPVSASRSRNPLTALGQQVHTLRGRRR